MKPNRSLLIVGFMLTTALSVLAGDVKVIANPGVRAESISTAELRSVFLMQRKTLQDGTPVTPVLQKSGPTHEAFLRQYMNRDSEEIRIYFQGLVFTGKGSMPKELSSDSEVVAYVARAKGAIGYVTSAASTDGVKELVVTSDGRNEGRNRERTLVTRVEPEYPETLQKLHIGGTVRLELTVSAKGAVESVALLGGNPILGEAAAKAAKQWVYSPWPSQTKIQVNIPFEPHP